MFQHHVRWYSFHYCRTLQYQWAAHQAANKQFAEVVFQHYQDGDMVWVQDYHLMLLPALLKNRKPKMKVPPPLGTARKHASLLALRPCK